MDWIKIALSSFFSAAALFLIAKIVGHKQMAQLDFFGYITGITIGSIAAEMATELDDPLKPLIAMAVYGAISYLLSLLTGKAQRFRKFINGTPSIILSNGKLYRRNMQKAKLDLSELMVMCRQEGYFDLNDIQTAIFEYNGRLTILPVSSKRPVNPEDLALSPKAAHISTEVIMDGHILEENLRRKGLDTNWLTKQLALQGYKSPKEIFLGLLGEENQLTLYSRD